MNPVIKNFEGQGDAVLVPANVEHHFTNTGVVMLSRVTANPLSSVGGA